MMDADSQSEGKQVCQVKIKGAAKVYHATWKGKTHSVCVAPLCHCDLLTVRIDRRIISYVPGTEADITRLGSAAAQPMIMIKYDSRINHDVFLSIDSAGKKTDCGWF